MDTGRQRQRDRQRQRERLRQKQRHSRRSSIFAGRLVLVPRLLLDLVRSISLLCLLAPPQHGPPQLHILLQPGYTRTTLVHLLVRSRS